ncbi:DNA-directed RNA polymerases I, II, and III subunit RPABC1 [Pancytospora philotis]|nr:DNA-directed RNA polymerases I, II, and III subunit RPABC1 [Pancytospora philotis]
MTAAAAEKKATVRELWLARNVVIEILAHRGYSTLQRVFNYADFQAHFPSAGSNCAVLNFVASGSALGENGEVAMLAIHFTSDEKLPKAALEALVGSYMGQGIQNVMLITPSKLNPSCKAYLKGTRLDVEHFLLQELQFNVLKHELVPPHRILPRADSDALLKRLKTEIGSLPVLLTSDIVCRYIGGKPGEIVEITRDSLTAGKTIYYRTVKEL